MIYYEIHAEGSCRKLSDVPKGATITEVNSRQCIGMCEVCGGPILEGQQYHHDSEGVTWHAGRCPGRKAKPC